MTIDELKEHCKRAIDPKNKLAFDVNSKTYQEHELTLNIIEELETLRHCKDKWDENHQQIKANAIDEYSSKLWQVIEAAKVNCKLDLTINDLHDLEIIIKGLAEELKEQ